MAELVNKIQAGLKRSSQDLFTFFVKLVSGSIISLTVALVIQEIMGKKDGEAMLSLVFAILIGIAVFFRISKKWNLTGVLIFDLICVLIGMVLRLYIMVAPGL